MFGSRVLLFGLCCCCSGSCVAVRVGLLLFGLCCRGCVPFGFAVGYVWWFGFGRGLCVVVRFWPWVMCGGSVLVRCVAGFCSCVVFVLAGNFIYVVHEFHIFL